MKSPREFSKLERQCSEIDLFNHSEFVDYEDVKLIYQVNVRTFQRDIQDLTDAGIIKVKYAIENEQGGYKKIGEPVLNMQGDERRKIHLEKLRRIKILMEELYDPYEDYLNKFEYDGEDDSIDAYSKALMKGAKEIEDTIVHQYTTLFPTLSARTRQRDFELLNNIGFLESYIDDELQVRRINIEMDLGYLYTYEDS